MKERKKGRKLSLVTVHLSKWFRDVIHSTQNKKIWFGVRERERQRENEKKEIERLREILIILRNKERERERMCGCLFQ